MNEVIKRKVIVSVHFRGKTASKLAWCVVRNGKTIASQKVIEDLKEKLGIKRGYTYSIS